MALSTSSGEVRFEGLSVGTEIWGATQANFLVSFPGRHAKEAAILLNDPAAKLLSEATGRENTPEFRAQAAAIAGEIILLDRLEHGAPIESVMSLSGSFFAEEPAVGDRIKAALAK
ncbi:MAG: hypothetical protein ABI577_00675 [bacterium]